MTEIVEPLIRDLFQMKASRFARLLEGEDIHYLKECIIFITGNTPKGEIVKIFGKHSELILRKLQMCYRFSDRIHFYNMVKKNEGKLSDKMMKEYGETLEKFSGYYPFMVNAFCKLCEQTNFGKLSLPQNLLQAPLDRPSQMKKQKKIQDRYVQQQMMMQ